MDVKTRLSRLFIPGAGGNNLLSLDAKNSHYLIHVMRGRIGDQVLVFDGVTGEYLAQINHVDRKGCSLKILHQTKSFIASHGPSLLFAPLKKPRLDILIEKAVELGVEALYPVMTQHTVYRHLTQEKLQEISIQAAEQCERLSIPQIHQPLDLKYLLETWDPEIPILVCVERLECLSLKKACAKFSQAKTFLIGPEGGFSPDEFMLMGQKPFVHFVTLGSEILRAETAGILALGYFKTNKED